jgi:uncharacterized protein YxjI
MRGVTYQEYQDRWKVAHTTSCGQKIQAYFKDFISAIREKLKLCFEDQTTPMSHANKRKDSIDKTLPVGLCDCVKKEHFMIISQVVTMTGNILRKEAKYRDDKGREKAINIVKKWRKNSINKILNATALSYGVKFH